LELIREHYDRVLIMGAPDILRADPKLDPLKFTEIAAGRQVVLFETRRPPGVS
jgi:predicted glycosyltransferase